jgi:hypothetical protein
VNSQVQELRNRIEQLEDAVGALAHMVLHLADAPKDGSVYDDALFDVSCLVDDKHPEDLVAQEDEERTDAEYLQAEPAQLQKIEAEHIDYKRQLSANLDSPDSPCTNCWKSEHCHGIDPAECQPKPKS